MAYTRGAVIKGTYRYTNQLLALNACKPQPGEEISKAKGGVTTPLSAAVWAVGLTEHPDPTFVEYIVKGLTGWGLTGSAPSSQPCPTYQCPTQR